MAEQIEFTFDDLTTAKLLDLMETELSVSIFVAACGSSYFSVAFPIEWGGLRMQTLIAWINKAKQRPKKQK